MPPPFKVCKGVKNSSLLGSPGYPFAAASAAQKLTAAGGGGDGDAAEDAAARRRRYFLSSDASLDNANVSYENLNMDHIAR